LKWRERSRINRRSRDIYKEYSKKSYTRRSKRLRDMVLPWELERFIYPSGQ